MPEFHSWFVRYQASDLKEMLLYPVRRDTSLGYDFYYNCDSESIHGNIKIQQDFKATDMPTVVKNICTEKDVNLGYVEDAIIWNGPHEPTPQFSNLQVDQHTWTYEWSEACKQNHLCKFHQALPTDPVCIGPMPRPEERFEQEEVQEGNEEGNEGKEEKEKEKKEEEHAARQSHLHAFWQTTCNRRTRLQQCHKEMDCLFPILRLAFLQFFSCCTPKLCVCWLTVKTL